MTSRMLAEALEAPSRVAAMLAEDTEAYARLAAELHASPPLFAATVARGSSDHAATFAASLLGIRLGLVTASLSPSLVTRYGAAPALRGALVLGLSQSGASPDIVRALKTGAADGAITAAVVNATDSPLARAAAHVLPQRAGAERSVAATKSFILTLTAVARLAAVWSRDRELAAALARLPERLAEAAACDWSPALPLLAGTGSLFVVGRGPGLGVAQETALKLKETSHLHAEALSAAELRHGPRAVIGPGFPVLAYALADPGGEDSRELAAELHEAGALVMTASAGEAPGLRLPLPRPLHPLLDPILAIQAFYPFAAALAVSRGLDPDQPRGLSKVTRTV